MSRKNNNKKYLTREQVNYLQGLAKMQGHNSYSLHAATGIPRPTIISVWNGTRKNFPAREAIAQVLGEPVEKLFPEPPAPSPSDATLKSGAEEVNAN